MKTRIISLSVFLVVVLIGVENVSACSCLGRETPAKAFAEATTILVGTVRKIAQVKDKRGFTDNRATFLVEEVLKGKRGEKIDVFTSSQGTACGYPFEEGSKYLVYAYENDLKEPRTNICVRTRPLSFGVEDDEIEILRSLSAGKFKPRIYGFVYELTRGIYPLREDYWSGRRPMQGVKVIARKGGKSFESVSDSKGRFSIANVPTGKFKLEFIVPPGYKLGGDYWDEPTEDEKDEYKNIEVEITQTDSPDALKIETRIDGRIMGTVVSDNGKPVGKDVMVSLISKKTAAKDVGDIDYIHAFTDSNGYFEFFGIPPGEYYLGFNLETKPSKNFPYPRTYFPSTTNLADAQVIRLSKAERLSGLTLTLPNKVEEVEVKGKVVDADGNPIVGAMVERYGIYHGEWREGDPYSLRYVKQPTFEGRVETDLRGEFTLRLLKGNKYRLNAYKDPLEGDDVDIEVSGNIQPITLVLDKKSK